MTYSFQDHLKTLRDPTTLVTPNAHTCEVTAVRLKVMFEEVTANAWNVDINLKTGQVHFLPPKKRLDEHLISDSDWQDIQRYINIGFIPYKARRYKIFADEVTTVFRKMAKIIGKRRLQELFDGDEHFSEALRNMY